MDAVPARSSRAAQGAMVICLCGMAAIVAAADLGWARPLFALMARVPLADKLGHFVLLGTAALAVGLVVGRRSRALLWGALLCLAAVITAEEITQLWIANRTFDLFDLTCNLAGVTCGGCVARWLLAPTRSRRSPP